MVKAKIAEAKTKTMALLGPVAFIVGLVIALGAAFITPSGLLYVGLAVIGVIVGLLNITAKEVGPFLFASIAFIVAVLGIQSLVTTALLPATLDPVFTRLAANIVTLVGAGAMIISLRAIIEMAKGK